jgi:hypothetical protein
MSGIFISYRRDDSAGHAGRLLDHLSRVFGADGVFMDVDDIRRGDTFADTLTERLRQADVLLAVIGKRWLTLTDAAGVRRLDNPDDWVRNEVSAGLSAGSLVIPVLVGGATLPATAELPEDLRALAARQMAEVRDGSWNDDVARLCKDIKQRRARGSWSEKLRGHGMSAAITLLLALAAGGYSTCTHLRSRRAVVPLVSGLSLDRATRAITDAGLQVGAVSRRATNDHPPDWVLEQDPATQTPVRKGTAVSLTVAAPRAVDLTPYVTVRDVGGEGTAAAAACVTAMDASLAAQGRPTLLSLRYVYEKAKRHDEAAGEGTFLETMIYVARQFGAPPEALWPYHEFERRLPRGVTWSALDRAAAAYKAEVTQVSDLDGVLGALDRKTPVLVVALVTSEWGSDLATKTGQVGPAGAEDKAPVAGVITIVGYDPATRRFKFANNWGAGWGDRGFGYLDASDARAVLQLDTGLWSVAVPPAGP